MLYPGKGRDLLHIWFNTGYGYVSGYLRVPTLFEPFSAETDKGGIGIPRRLDHPVTPFAFQVMDIPSGRDPAGMVMGLGSQRRHEPLDERGRGHGAPIGKDHHVSLFLERDVIVGQVIMLDKQPDHLPKALFWALRAGLEQQLAQGDAPELLLAAIVPRQRP